MKVSFLKQQKCYLTFLLSCASQDLHLATELLSFLEAFRREELQFVCKIINAAWSWGQKAHGADKSVVIVKYRFQITQMKPRLLPARSTLLKATAEAISIEIFRKPRVFVYISLVKFSPSYSLKRFLLSSATRFLFFFFSAS